jgi:hypothetical protein
MRLATDMMECLPEDDIVHLIVEAVELTEPLKSSRRATGAQCAPPAQVNPVSFVHR